MSKQIDERVVSMKFDNSDFETNAKNSMGTLDKLKEKLNFDRSAKNLDNFGKATSKVNLNPLGQSADAVKVKFDALQVAGMAAIQNITNSAVNAAKNILQSFTVQPIIDGFNEYELKMGSIQTIMASTGESLQTVNGYLNELNTYSDKTIYSFSDMTQNIGKFTNAGVKLKDAVAAIQGVSNEAAVSGANANEASRAMYNFAQALSAGYVKLIDWKSIENANMATVEFKNQLIETAVACGTLADAGDGMYKVLTTNAQGSSMDEAISATQNFNDSLNYQWMTTEVLTKTLGKYADANTDIGKKAFAAAQDVKTFSMMMDTLKESVGSGWAETSEIVFGNFEQAKSLWTNLTNMFSDGISKIQTARNNFLRGALSTGWDQLIQKIQDAGLSTDAFVDKFEQNCRDAGIDIDGLIDQWGDLGTAIEHIDNAKDIIKNTFHQIIGDTEAATDSVQASTQAFQDFSDIVNQVIRGNFGNGADRVRALTEAGYDYTTVQDLVNKKLRGESIEIQNVSDAQLEQMGYTEDQIKILRDLSAQADETGTDLNTLLEQMTRKSGRELLFESLQNVLKTISSIFGDIGKAAQDAFGKIQSSSLYNFLVRVNDATSKIYQNVQDNSDKIMRSFRGFFSVLDIVRQALGAVWKIISHIAGVFGKDFLGPSNKKLLDFTANLGDSIYNIDQFLKKSKAFDKFADTVNNAFDRVVVKLKEFWSAFKDTKVYEVLDTAFGKIKKNFSDFMKNLSSEEGLAKIKEDFTKFGEEIAKPFEALAENPIFQKIKDKISDVFGSLFGSKEDTSKISKDVSPKISFGNTISSASDFKDKFINDFLPKLTNALSEAGDKIKEFGGVVKDNLGSSFNDMAKGLGSAGSAIADFFGKINKALGKSENQKALASIGTFAVNMLLLYKTMKMFSQILSIMSGVTGALQSLFGGIGAGIKQWGKAQKIKAIGETVMDLAKAIAIIAGVLTALTVVAKKDPKDLWMAVGVISTLAGVITALAVAISKINGGDTESIADGLNSLSSSSLFIAISMSIGILAKALKTLAGIDASEIAKAETAVLTMGGMLTLFVYELNKSGGGIKQGLGNAISMIGVALAIKMVADTLIKLDKYDFKHLGRTLVLAATCIGMLGTIAVIMGKSHVGASQGFGMMGLVISLYMMSTWLVLISHVKWSTIGKAIGKALICIGLLWLVSLATQKFNVGASQGLGMIGIAASLYILGLSLQKIGSLSIKQLGKAIIAIGLLSQVFVGVQNALKNVRKDKAKTMIKTLLAFAVAMGVMGIVTSLLGQMNTKQLAKGLIAVGVLSALLIAIMKVAENAKGSDKAVKLLKTAIAGIIVLVGALIALSLLDTTRLLGAAGSLTLVMLSFAATLKVISNIKTPLKTAVPIMALMLGVVAGLATILTLMSTKIKDPMGAVKSAAAIAIVMTSMGVAMKLMSNVGKVSKNAMATLAILTACVAGIGLTIAAVVKIGGQNINQAITVAAAISIVLMSMASALKEASTIESVSKSVMKTIAELAIVVGAIGTVIGLVCGLSGNLDKAITVASAISIVLLSMAASLKIISTIKSVSTSSIVGMLALSAVVAILGAVIGLVCGLSKNLDKSIEVATSISILLGALTGTLAVLTVIGPAATLAYPAIGALIVLASALITFLVVLGEISKKAKGMQSAIEAAFEILKTIAKGFGEVIAAFAEGVTSTLPDIGQNMSEFWEKAQPFFDGIAQISPSTGDNIKKLFGSLKELSEGNFLDTLSKWFGGDSALVQYGSNLPIFGEQIRAFATSVEGIDANGIDALVTVLDKMSQLKFTPSDGFATLFTGDRSLSTFLSNFNSIIGPLKDFASAIQGFGSFDTSGIDSLINILDKMGGLKFTPSDGVVTMFTGDKSLSTFLTNINGCMGSLKEFANNIQGFGSFDTSGIDSLITILDKMGNLKFTPSDGVVTMFTGDKSLSTFLTNMNGCMGPFKIFINALQGFGSFDTSGMDSLINILDKMGRLKFTPGDGFATMFAGDKSLPTFLTNMNGCIGTLKSFVNSIGPFSSINIDSFDGLIDVLEKMGKLKFTPSDGVGVTFKGDKSLSAFLKGMNDNMGALRTFVSGINGLGSLNIKNVKDLPEVLNTFSKINVNSSGMDGLKTFLDKLSKLDFSGLKALESGLSGVSVSLVQSITSSIKQITSLLTATYGTVIYAVQNIINGVISEVGQLSFGLITAGSMIVLTVNGTISQVMGLLNAAYSTIIFAIQNMANGIMTTLAGILIQLTSFGSIIFGAINSLISQIAQLLNAAYSTINFAITNMINSAIATIMGSVGQFAAAGMSISQALAMGITMSLGVITASLAATIASAAGIVSGYSGRFMAAGLIIGLGLVSGVRSGLSGVTPAVNTIMAASFAVAISFIGRFRSSGMQLGQAIAMGIRGTSAAIIGAVTSNLSSVASTISSFSGRFRSGGSALGNALADGLRSGSLSARTACVAAVGAAAASVSGYRGAFYSAGANLAYGLAAGISSHASVAVNAAASMARQAVQAAQAAAQIHSPSRATYKLGKFFVYGWANAVCDYMNLAADASVKMVDQSLDAVNGMASGFNDIFDNLDVNPVISPTMDMTNVMNGVAAINDAFATTDQLAANINEAGTTGILGNVTGIQDMVSSLTTEVNNLKGAVDDLKESEANRNYTFESSIELDGRQLGKASAKYTKPEIDRLTTISRRKAGYIG